jgi:long-chain acyl-CoA synthetase
VGRVRAVYGRAVRKDQPLGSGTVARVQDLIERGAKLHGDRPFVLRHEPAGWAGLSFVESARAVRAFAHLLADHGLGAGARIAIQAENRPEWALGYLGALAAGAVLVPLDLQLTPEETGEILATAEVTHAIVSRRSRAVMEAARRARRPALTLVSLDDEPDLPSWPEALRRFPDAGALPINGAAEEVAVVLFTSGTTGAAKGVMLTHANLLSNVETVANTLEFGAADRFLSVLPLHHTFEFMGGFLCPLRVGASVAYARGLKSGELREDIASSGATILLGVPLLHEKFLEGLHRGIDHAPLARRWMARALMTASRAIRLSTGRRVGHALLRSLRERAGLGSLRLLVSGAAALATEVFWEFVDLGIPLIEGYGLTECSPVVAANHPPRPKAGAVGWPLPGVDVRIEDADDEGNGEVLVRGPNVMKGYFHDPARTAEVLQDGWLRTGDLGKLLSDGRLKITGRLKTMIATAAGKKVYPEEVETRLSRSPFVLEVVVVGGHGPHAEREEVHAHVFPNLERLEGLAREQGGSVDDAFVESAIRREVDTLSQALAPYKRPRRVIVRREPFPRTATGKIVRQAAIDEEARREEERLA